MKINKTKQPPVAQAAVLDGWKLVPVFPTPAMVDAGFDAMSINNMDETDAVLCYYAMLAAAPQAPQRQVSTLTDAELLKLAEKYYRPNVDALEDMVAFGRAVMAATTQPQAVDEARLQFMIDHEAWIAWGRDHESCRVFVQDEDGDTHPIMGWVPEASASTAREAIDAAIAAMAARGAK